jgi:hypothetical protein
LNPDIYQCIDAGLDTIGTSSKRIVYWYLSQKRNLSREKIPDNPTVFLDSLKTLFGQGAGILERTIIRELRQAFNITLGENLEEVLALIKRKSSSSITGNNSRTSSTGLNPED